MSRTYIEKFEQGPGGWFGWVSNHAGPKPLEWSAGALTSRSPWWIDYNHAPPGAGYLHILFALLTSGAAYGESLIDAGGLNRFIEQDQPTNFQGARVTLRMRGELENRGAQLSLLVQGTVEGITSGWVLTGAPFKVTHEWSEQTALVSVEASQWTCLGSRHGRTKTYGTIPLETILSNVNTDIILVLFPLTVVPMGPLAGDPHLLRPARDYPV